MLPSGLSMLWETVDPEQALRARFGFDGLPAAVDWIVATLDEVWGVDVVGCGRLVLSGPNAIGWAASRHGPLVVKWSNAHDRFASLATSTRLLQQLDRRGIPVAAPLTTTDGRVRVTQDGPLGALSVAVLPEVAGEWLDVADAAAVRAAGACLAAVHAALRDSPEQRPPSTVALSAGRIEHWLAHDDHGWAPSASARLAGLVAALPPLDDDIQLVHNDFRAANLLTRESRVVGVLDFDEVSWNHRVDDLAKASVYLSTRFTDWRPTPAAVRRDFRTGYESVRPLGPAENQWLDTLVLWHEILAIPLVQDPAGWARGVTGS